MSSARSNTDTPLYTIYDPKASKHPHYSLAVEVIEKVHARFPAGAVNQKAVSDNLKLNAEELKQQLEVFSVLVNEIDGQCRPTILAEISETLDRANCGIMASYAIGSLMDSHSQIRPEQIFISKSHTMLAIARKKISDKNDIRTWDALICDPWAKLIYRSSHFKHAQSGTNIPFHENVVNADTGLVLYTRLNTSHYLNGNPEIEEGPASAAIDQALKKWVLADTQSWILRGKTTVFKPSSHVEEYRKTSASSYSIGGLSFDLGGLSFASASSSSSSYLPVSPVVKKIYSSGDKETIRAHLAGLTGYESSQFKATNKDGVLKFYLTLKNPNDVLVLKNALNATRVVDATERTEKGSNQALILEITNIKTALLLDMKNLKGYTVNKAKQSTMEMKK